FIEAAAAELELEVTWKGKGADEVGSVARASRRWPALQEGQIIVRIDPRYFRPSEVDTLLGDPRKAKTELGWAPKITFPQLVAEERPETVLLAAANVGGIVANNTYPAHFIHDNLAIQTNVIHEAWRSGVKKLLFLGSSCIYPRDCPQPMKEEYLLTGPLEPTNEWYAVAKIAGIKMCQAYRREFGFNAICLMPTNLYGPGDNFDLESSHVLPALIRRFHEAKLRGDAQVVAWGTGTP